MATSVACGGESTPPPVTPTAPTASVEAPVPAPRRPVRLSYLAPSDCPTVDGYLNHVRARSAGLRLQPGDVPEASDSVDVRLDPDLDQSGWLGSLRIEGAKPLEREVRGDRCDDVVAALALITVLRLEGADVGSAAAAGAATAGANAGAAGAATAGVAAPGAAAPGAASNAAGAGATAAEPAPSVPGPPEATPSTATPAEPPEAATPEPTPDAETSTPEPEPAEPMPGAVTATEPATPPNAAAAPGAAAVPGSNEPPPLQPDQPIIVSSPAERGEPGASDVDARSAEPSEPLQLRLLPALALLAGYATEPSQAFRITLEGELRYGDDLGSWASPLSLSFARGAEQDPAADVAITLLTAQLGLCPPAALRASWVWLRACANVRGGAVHVAITPRIVGPDEDDAWRPWLAVAPSLQVGFPVSERWTIRAVGELALQLVRDTFGVPLDAGPDPDFLPLYRPEAISLEVGIGVGYGF